MKIRLADYVADFLVSHDITDCFTVTGGGAMHLNDALGHKEGLHCLYNHHEQACAIASVEKGSGGLKVKFYDKLKALELLGKAVGLFEGGAQAPEDNGLLEAILTATRATGRMDN